MGIHDRDYMRRPLGGEPGNSADKLERFLSKHPCLPIILISSVILSIVVIILVSKLLK